jgi:hypothetical protein
VLGTGISTPAETRDGRVFIPGHQWAISVIWNKRVKARHGGAGAERRDKSGAVGAGSDDPRRIAR